MPAPTDDPQLDAELNSIAVVISSLLTVDSDARQRVLAYAARRFPAPVSPTYSLQSAQQFAANQGLR